MFFRKLIEALKRFLSLLSHPAWAGIGGLIAIIALVYTVKNKSQKLPPVLQDPVEISKKCSWEPKIGFDGRVAKIKFNNASLYEMRVTLWHPDTKSPFKTYTIHSQIKIELDLGQPGTGIGSDWGIQVGDSKHPVCSIYEVADWVTDSNGGNSWLVSSNKLYD